jgi:hypothetical protein
MMKKVQLVIAWLLSAVCLLISVAFVLMTRGNQALQADLQQQAALVQNDTRTVAGTEQISRNILTDLGNAAISDAEIRAVLEKHGYTLTANQPAASPPAISQNPSPTVPASPMSPSLVAPVAPVPVAASAVSAPVMQTPEVVTPPVSVPAGQEVESKPLEKKP